MRKIKKAVSKPRYTTAEYRAWYAMMDRCYNPKNSRFHRYGGRGILVHERWHIIDNFLNDMGAKPHSKLTLDRIDNDKGYSPSNCRWATHSEQNKNRNKFWHKDTLTLINGFDSSC